MAERDMRKTADIELEFPVDFNGETITSLTMRRPKVRDGLKAEKAKGGDMERGLALMVELLERPIELLVELDEIDLEKVQAQYMAFTGRQDTMNLES